MTWEIGWSPLGYLLSLCMELLVSHHPSPPIGLCLTTPFCLNPGFFCHSFPLCMLSAPLLALATAETGALLTSVRDTATDKAWNWLRAEGRIVDYLELLPQGSDTFEVIVKDGWPAKIMSNREDGAYATKDLMLRHPEHKTWFKYVGRMDDTLTQTLGEKTNPVPIELAIVSDSQFWS